MEQLRVENVKVREDRQHSQEGEREIPIYLLSFYLMDTRENVVVLFGAVWFLDTRINGRESKKWF